MDAHKMPPKGLVWPTVRVKYRCLMELAVLKLQPCPGLGHQWQVVLWASLTEDWVQCPG